MYNGVDASNEVSLAYFFIWMEVMLFMRVLTHIGLSGEADYIQKLSGALPKCITSLDFCMCKIMVTTTQYVRVHELERRANNIEHRQF